MDETTRNIIERITRHYPGPTTLPTGHVSSRYYASRELATSDLARLAAAATGHRAGEVFDVAVAAGLTGVFFVVEASAGKQVGLLCPDNSLFGAPIHGARVALVDDVVCSGSTLQAARRQVEALGGTVVAYIVMVDRLSPAGELDGVPVWSAWQDEL